MFFLSLSPVSLVIFPLKLPPPPKKNLIMHPFEKGLYVEKNLSDMNTCQYQNNDPLK